MTDATIRYANDPPSALPRGTRLGEFELIKVVGIGGFGIVYEAFDHALERGVAVKEYMPASLAGRTETMHVTLRSQSDAETFALGLKSFINEGRLLARFDLPSLIRVHRFWEANGTAYMAMPLLRGKSVKALRQAMTQPPDEAWLRALLGPLLSTLEHLHAEGVYHRDISPDNIHLEADGRPVLLDLGAARRVIGDATQTLTAILKPAYAPIEQYAEIGGVRQGPWTDLYSLGATLHFLLLGRPPAPATARTISDEQPPLAAQTLPGVSVAFAQVVDWMLSPRPDARPRSVAMVRDAFDGLLSPPVRAVVEPVAPVGWERTQLLPGNTGGRTGTTGTSGTTGTTATKGAQTSQTDVDLSQLTAAAGMTVVPPLPPSPPATARPASTSAPMSVPVAVAPASVPASVPANKSKVWLLGGAAAAAAAVVAVLAFRAGGSAPAPAEAVSAAPPVASAPLQTDGDARPAAVLTPPLIAAAGPAPAATLPAAGSTSPVAGPTSTAARPPAALPSAARPPAVSPPAASPAAANARPLAAPATVAVPAAGDAALPVTRPATAAVRPAATATADTPRAPRPAPGGRPTVLSTPTTEPQGMQAAPGPAPTPASPDPQRTAPAGPATAPAMALPTLPTLPGTAGAAVQVISGPIERCGRRVLVAQWLCIQKECEKRELRSHPECIKWLKDQDDKSRTQF